MIAWAGIKRFKKDLIDNLEIPAKSRWPLDLKAPYMKGPGLKLSENSKNSRQRRQKNIQKFLVIRIRSIQMI